LKVKGLEENSRVRGKKGGANGGREENASRASIERRETAKADEGENTGKEKYHLIQ